MVPAALIVSIAIAAPFAGLGMTGHMAAHMLAVAIAPIGVAIAWPLHRPAPRPGASRDMGPLGWAVAEFAVVWAWHAPALRALADSHGTITLVEQLCFLGVGVGLWRSAFRWPAAGAGALLLTSMHMTLLGALIALAPRPLYDAMAMHPMAGLDALADQQLGGAVMLAVGAVSYLAGGLWMFGRILRLRTA